MSDNDVRRRDFLKAVGAAAAISAAPQLLGGANTPPPAYDIPAITPPTIPSGVPPKALRDWQFRRASTQSRTLPTRWPRKYPHAR